MRNIELIRYNDKIVELFTEIYQDELNLSTSLAKRVEREFLERYPFLAVLMPKFIEEIKQYIETQLQEKGNAFEYSSNQLIQNLKNHVVERSKILFNLDNADFAEHLGKKLPEQLQITFSKHMGLAILTQVSQQKNTHVYAIGRAINDELHNRLIINEKKITSKEHNRCLYTLSRLHFILVENQCSKEKFILDAGSLTGTSINGPLSIIEKGESYNKSENFRKKILEDAKISLDILSHSLEQNKSAKDTHSKTDPYFCAYSEEVTKSMEAIIANDEPLQKQIIETIQQEEIRIQSTKDKIGCYALADTDYTISVGPRDKDTKRAFYEFLYTTNSNLIVEINLVNYESQRNKDIAKDESDKLTIAIEELEKLAECPIKLEVTESNYVTTEGHNYSPLIFSLKQSPMTRKPLNVVSENKLLDTIYNEIKENGYFNKSLLLCPCNKQPLFNAVIINIGVERITISEETAAVLITNFPSSVALIAPNLVIRHLCEYFKNELSVKNEDFKLSNLNSF